MTEFKQNYSFIISFQNRDLIRVKKSLDSLQNQTIQNFEVIFVNYGSYENVTAELETLLLNYSFCKYIYTETRGLLWNKCVALNIGINNSTGENIIISDIDIIFENQFIEKILNYDLKTNFLAFNAVYLPKDNLKPIEEITSNTGLQVSFIGLTVVKKEYLIQINGYDEFYQIWGAEDDDVIKRLELINVKRLNLEPPNIKIYHQWHELNSPQLPTIWYHTLVTYLFTNNNIKQKYSENWGQILTKSERPSLNIYQNNNYQNYYNLQLFGKNLLCFLKIYIDFFELNSNEICYFEIENWNKEITGKMTKLVTMFNKILDKLKLFHYRFIRVEKINQKPEITFEDVHQFWIYFIGVNRGFIKDYYYEKTENKILVILIKIVKS